MRVRRSIWALREQGEIGTGKNAVHALMIERAADMPVMLYNYRAAKA
jgi:hypothetical protein